ncbi:MAG: hypothetical protein M3552_19155 [Planctomycetota bacterium]|nr:hypothetical protein [Planctomycetaceae bacterium]MDQ3332735.1 hypothetical protein [Planctomycetota bacterium]
MASVLDRPVGKHGPAAAHKPWPTIRAWHLILLATFVAGGFSIFFRLGEAKSLGSHEGYAIVPAREMLLSGDYIVPRFGEMPRLKKPPLIYWSIIAAAKVTGGLDIATARLPAALSGLALAGLMSAWAFRWYGRAAAIGAAAAQLTSVYVLVFARRAEADMILVLLIAASLAIIASHRPSESRATSFLRWLGLWACAAIAWLGKFHFGPAMIFVPAVAWLVFERRWRMLLGLFNPIGLLVFAAAAGIWPALILQRLPQAWDIWQEETIGRAVGELGRQPFWYYVPHLAAWTLPWTLFAVLAWPASARAAFRGLSGAVSRVSHPHSVRFLSELDREWRRIVSAGDSRERFLWVWFIMTFAMVTISANKHPHYVLPALPAFSLWTAQRLRQLHEQAQRGERILPASLAVLLTLLAICGGIVPFALSGKLPSGVTPPMLAAVMGTAGVGVAVAGWLLYFRLHRIASVTLLAAWMLAYGFAAMQLIPAQDHRLGAYRFAEDARKRYGGNVEIGIYGMDQDAAVWHLGEPLFRAETPSQIAARLKSTSRLRLITLAEHQSLLSELGDLQIVERFADYPDLPAVELGHYRQMMLIELSRPTIAGLSPPRR